MPRLAALALAATLLSGTPALAAHLPNFMPAFPIEHLTEARTQPQPESPYAMNYADEVARAMGVKSGRMDLFDTGAPGDGLLPSIKGGVDRGGAMLRLQWHPGE
jgi:hypothetical protein